MGEEEPVLHLNLTNGERYDLTRENGTLYRFCGQLAMYDHAFLVLDEEKGKGLYVFGTNPTFGKIAKHMIKHNYPAHLNLRQVAECDMRAFDAMIAKDAGEDLEGGVPEGWL
jgi:hypothetical protein